MSVSFGWGPEACHEAAERNDVVVIVDTLSFSTMAVTAVENGFSIIPCRSHAEAKKAVSDRDSELAVGRSQVPEKGRFSLSPLTFEGAEGGHVVAVFSPNGATCCVESEGAREVLIGSLRNATAVAGKALEISAGSDCGITVVACGERERDTNGAICLRQAEEDFVAAGAVLAAINLSLAKPCEKARGYYLLHADRLEPLLHECPSGKWLIERGFGEDVVFAARFDKSKCVPIYREGRLGREIDQ